MSDKLQKATHRGILNIGTIELACFVLEDGTRVISGRGMTKAIDMRGRGQGVRRIPTHKTLKLFIDKELAMAIENPIEFLGYSPQASRPTQGYEATVLVQICESVLNARDADALKTEQELRYAKACDILMRAFATVGIIALVDEATGYQEVRDRLALQKILERYISNELLPWTKRFPDEFYKEMFRLRDWQYSPVSVKRPSLVGRLTNNIIYERLAPGVLKELQRITPRDAKGRTRHRFHQRLTEDVGHPKLAGHLSGVITLMKASSNWAGFYRLIQRALPKCGDTLPLPFEEE